MEEKTTTTSFQPVHIPFVRNRSDGRCPLCAGRNASNGRNGCAQCWREYHKSRAQKLKLRLEIADLFNRAHEDKDLNLAPYILMDDNPMPEGLREQYQAVIDEYEWRDRNLENHWKRWKALRKLGQVPQGVMFEEWYTLGTEYGPLLEQYRQDPAKRF